MENTYNKDDMINHYNNYVMEDKFTDGVPNFFEENTYNKYKMKIIEKKSIETTPDGFVIEITNGKKKLIKYNGKASQIKIPEDITYISDRAFAYCTSLKTITIPESVKSIGDAAFSNCTNLIEIKLPESVEYIGSKAFSNCTSLKTITIPEGVKSINSKLFYGCTSLYEINLPKTIESIGESSFSNCTSIRKINIPSGVITIEQEAFAYCKKLEEIELPESIRSICSKAFYECKFLKRIAIPEGIQNIEPETFSGCTYLKEVDLPESIKKIWSGAFYGCNSLKKITLPRNVTQIGDRAFFNCYSLREITVFKSIEDNIEHIFNFSDNEAANDMFYITRDVQSLEKYLYKESQLYDTHGTYPPLKIGKVKYKNFVFYSYGQLTKSILELMEEENIIARKDDLPIYFERNDEATQILKQIFKNTNKEKVKINILDRYDESSFLENIKFLQKVIPTSITLNGEEITINENQRRNIIANIFTKNPQLLQENIEITVLNNYQYLVNQKILSEEELHSYYFGYSVSELIKRSKITKEETQSKNSEYIIKILSLYFQENYNPQDIFSNAIPTLFSTLVVESTPKSKLDLRDRLLLASIISHDNKKERMETLKGSSFETVCRNDEIDFVEERGLSSKIFFKGYDMFKGIKTSLYRKLNGMNSDLVKDLNALAEENQQNIFLNFLNSLETIKNWNLFDSEIERANYFRNEFVGRLLYAYLKIVKQKKDELSLTPEVQNTPYNTALRNIDFTNPETIRMDLFYKNPEISIVDIVCEATKNQEKLFDDPELIETMLMIMPYSYDALKNYSSQEQNEYCIYANLAKKYGYLFKKEEKESISAKIKDIKSNIRNDKNNKQKSGESTEELDRKLSRIDTIFGKNFMSIENVDHFIEYVNNQLGLTKVSKNQKEKYLKEMEKILTQYIAGEQEQNIIDILRSIDLYCRINNEAELQTTQGYEFSAEALFDARRIEEFSHADRIMYCLFHMNKLAHNSKDINLLAMIKDDYRFAGFHEHSHLLKKALDGYNKLEKYGLTLDCVNHMLHMFKTDNLNNIFRQHLSTTSTIDLNDLIDGWSKFSKGIYNQLQGEQSIGTTTEEDYPTEQEINELTVSIKAKLPYLNEDEQEKLKILLSATSIDLTKEEEKEKETLEQRGNLSEPEQKRLKELQRKLDLSNILDCPPLTPEEKNILIELKGKEKTYKQLEKMGILEEYRLKSYKPTSEESEILTNLNNRKAIEIIKKIKNISDCLLPIAALNSQEVEAIKILSEEYILFFKAKTTLTANLINSFMKKEEQSLLSALSLNKKEKKEFYKKHGYIIEIQETDNGPTLVCLNKKLTKPFSVHIKDLSSDLCAAIEEIRSVEPTIAHTNIESSNQYPTLKHEKIHQPTGNDLKGIKIKAGFNNCSGDKAWKDYIISLYNYAIYDYDESTFVRREIEKNEKNEKNQETLFFLIEKRINADPKDIENIQKVFRDSLQIESQEEKEKLTKIFKENHLDSTAILLGTEEENNERLAKLVELYAECYPTMVKVVNEEKEGKQVQQIKISCNKKEKTLDLSIDTNRFTNGITIKGERIKADIQQEDPMQSESKTPSIQQEDPIQSESKKKLMSGFVPRFKNIIKSISESIHHMVIKKGQVPGKQVTKTNSETPKNTKKS